MAIKSPLNYLQPIYVSLFSLDHYICWYFHRCCVSFASDMKTSQLKYCVCHHNHLYLPLFIFPVQKHAQLFLLVFVFDASSILLHDRHCWILNSCGKLSFWVLKYIVWYFTFRFIFDAMHAVTGAYAKPIFVDKLGASLVFSGWDILKIFLNYPIFPDNIC